jgi:hypothetical protein
VPEALHPATLHPLRETWTFTNGRAHRSGGSRTHSPGDDDGDQQLGRWATRPTPTSAK